MQLFLRWLLALLVTTLGLLLVVAAVDDTFGRRSVAWLEGLFDTHASRFALAGAGMSMLTAQALLLMRLLHQRRFARELSYENALGRISVSIAALEEALTRVIEHQPGVRRVNLRVYEDRSKQTVIIEPSLVLWEDCDVTATSQRCQEVLHARFRALLPERSQVQVHLNLQRLKQHPGVEERRTTSKPSALPHIDPAAETCWEEPPSNEVALSTTTAAMLDPQAEDAADEEDRDEEDAADDGAGHEPLPQTPR